MLQGLLEGHGLFTGRGLLACREAFLKGGALGLPNLPEGWGLLTPHSLPGQEQPVGGVEPVEGAWSPWKVMA